MRKRRKSRSAYFVMTGSGVRIPLAAPGKSITYLFKAQSLKRRVRTVSAKAMRTNEGAGQSWGAVAAGEPGRRTCKIIRRCADDMGGAALPRGVRASRHDQRISIG